MSIQQLSEQEQLRREKLAELIIMGIEPYPAPLYPVNSNSVYIKQNYSEERKEEFADVCLAGRLMSVRDMGKANFAVIQDAHGKIQLYIRRDDICPGEDKSLYDIVWKKLIDIGDIIGVKGYVFTTKTGETSIHVKEFSILTKSLHPLPVVKEAYRSSRIFLIGFCKNIIGCNKGPCKIVHTTYMGIKQIGLVC